MNRQVLFEDMAENRVTSRFRPECEVPYFISDSRSRYGWDPCPDWEGGGTIEGMNEKALDVYMFVRSSVPWSPAILSNAEATMEATDSSWT